jgi:hypothetical protein
METPHESLAIVGHARGVAGPVATPQGGGEGRVGGGQAAPGGAMSVLPAAAKQQTIRRVVDRNVSVQAGATAITLTQGDSASVILTVSRSQYRQAIVATMSGLPTGVTATFKQGAVTSNVLQKDDTTLTLVLTAAVDATAVVDDPCTLTLSSGLPDQTVAMTVTVEAGASVGSPPIIQSFVPRSAPVSTTQAVTITGLNFLAGSTVDVGGTAATNVTVVSATTITATFPALAQGTYDVVVTHSDGSATAPLQYVAGVVPFHEETFQNGALNPVGEVDYVAYTYNSGGNKVVARSTHAQLSNTPLRQRIVSATPGDPQYEVGAQVKPGYTHSYLASYRAGVLGEIANLPSLNMGWTTGRVELWIEVELFIPSNWAQQSHPTAGSNAKWMSVWGNGYSVGHVPTGGTEGPANLWQLWPTGDGNSRIDIAVRTRNSSGKKILPYDYHTSAIRVQLIGNGGPVVKGDWNTFRYYTREATSLSVPDGAFKLWVNGTKLMDRTDRKNNIEDAPPTGYKNLYILGPINQVFLEDTVCFIQWVKLYDVDPGWT